MTTIRMKYKNYRNEVSMRTIEPIDMFFGRTDYHPQNQWLLRAYDFEKKQERIFALKDCDFLSTQINGIKPVGENHVQN